MITTLEVILVILAGAYGVAIIEEWVTTGRFRPALPLLWGVAQLGRESVVPRKSDRMLFEIAPALLLVAAVTAFTVLPLAPGAIITDLATGALFVNAALAYVMVALVMAGWGPDSVYATIGGWRFLAQLVAYGMLIVMPLAAVAMRAQSLSTTAVVSSQTTLWNIFTQPLGFIIFALAAQMVCFLPPFDLPTAEGELAGGVAGEYSGVRLAVFRLGRLILIFTLSTTITTFYLGGWLGPGLPGWSWTVLKSLVVASLMLLAGRYLPRLREADVLAWSWKLGIPLALTNIFWVGVTLLVVK